MFFGHFVQVMDADTEQQPEQEHSEAENYSALMDSLIFDYFAQDHNNRDGIFDDLEESTESEERLGVKHMQELEGTER